MMSGTLPYAKLYTDDSGVTHFADEALPWQQTIRDSQPRPVWTTAFQDAQRLGYLRAAAGYFSPWHPAPCKQFVMVLAGRMEVEAGDGETRVFTPGTVLCVTDIVGRGHQTRVVGADDLLLVWVPIP